MSIYDYNFRELTGPPVSDGLVGEPDNEWVLTTFEKNGLIQVRARMEALVPEPKRVAFVEELKLSFAAIRGFHTPFLQIVDGVWRPMIWNGGWCFYRCCHVTRGSPRMSVLLNIEQVQDPLLRATILEQHRRRSFYPRKKAAEALVTKDPDVKDS